MPGSHVIVKTEGETELPDSTYEEAARLAAFYSTGKDAPKVDIDYTARKNLKKPPKAKPGYVIYHTNYSMTIEPDIHGIREV
jgi:predicted ribosome quality control (RQC) complex YloA/Tae2 family protein